MNFKRLYISFALLGMLLLPRCSAVYHGVGEVSNFNPSLQSDALGDEILLYEDGMRTDGNNGEYEWWYFDSKLDDGSVVVAYWIICK